MMGNYKLLQAAFIKAGINKVPLPLIFPITQLHGSMQHPCCFSPCRCMFNLKAASNQIQQLSRTRSFLSCGS